LKGRVRTQEATERDAAAESVLVERVRKTTPEGPQSGTVIPLSSAKSDRHILAGKQGGTA
jgi:hypothetical protein